mmetsp:Transcript_49857/g.147344  ORF Transcript_49857/g.147344 Transcript_49857/m.147344 type:complete len:301 (-) Transcript_49857:28-930(-)
MLVAACSGSEAFAASSSACSSALGPCGSAAASGFSAWSGAPSSPASFAASPGWSTSKRTSSISAKARSLLSQCRFWRCDSSSSSSSSVPSAPSFRRAPTSAVSSRGFQSSCSCCTVQVSAAASAASRSLISSASSPQPLSRSVWRWCAAGSASLRTSSVGPSSSVEVIASVGPSFSGELGSVPGGSRCGWAADPAADAPRSEGDNRPFSGDGDRAADRRPFSGEGGRKAARAEVVLLDDGLRAPDVGGGVGASGTGGSSAVCGTTPSAWQSFAKSYRRWPVRSTSFAASSGSSPTKSLAP